MPLIRAPLMALIISRSAMLATWPLLAFNFREVALPGIAITVLALPAMPFLLVGTLLTAVPGLFAVPVARFFSWLVWVPASYLIELVEIAPSWTVQTEWAEVWIVWVWYAVLGGLLLLVSPGRLWFQLKDGAESLVLRPVEPGKTVPIAIGAFLMTIVSVAIWCQVSSGGDGNLHVYFFDVGQGDSALIVPPRAARS